LRAFGKAVAALLLTGGLLWGCSSNGPFATSRAVWREAEGRSVKPAWQPANAARLQARREALEEARIKIWDALMKEELEGGMTFEQLAMTDPVFESRLRGLIAGLRPAEITEPPDGGLSLKVRFDESQARMLALQYMKR